MIEKARSGPPAVVDLDDDAGGDARLTGAKAAALARARKAGLPVLPGFVVTTYAGETDDPGISRAWRQLTRDGSVPVVVRSSSAVEDGATSSMAGVFTSVLGVAGPSAFAAAVAEVRASASANVVALTAPAPMAVLVQPMLDAASGGVLFGADPVTGRRDRLVVAVIEGGPDRLVQGQDTGAVVRLSRRGRLVEGDAAALAPFVRRALGRLARQAEALFDGPQDIEWALDRNGTLWLLQSRPITALASRPSRRSPRLGPGPVAETFSGPLSPLEEDLWVEPLRQGLRHALLLSGVVSRRRVAASPVVAVIRGRVAADLDLLDPAPVRGIRRLDPRPSVRRLTAAWRVGRLHAALPALGADLVGRVDHDLAAVPPLATLDTRQLLGVIRRVRDGLGAVHGHEVLAGQLLHAEASGPTGAALALRALAEGRAEGLSDAEIVARDPVVLTLSPPAVGPGPALPATPTVLPPLPLGAPPSAVVREALRLRVRWLQELSARAAWELGSRLFDTPETVRSLHLADLEAAVAGQVEVAAGCFQAHADQPGPPLPAAFRLADDGSLVIDLRDRKRGQQGGTGAGGGRGGGIVHAPGDDLPAGSVLVVTTLDPALASLLPGLGGLVAETGSVLSHLAILAREMGVPTVVGVDEAVTRFPVGSTLVVDGATGEVRIESSDEEVAS